MADPRLIADLKRAEGCKLVAYRDGRGFWTIGFGHLLDQSHDWTGYTIDMVTALGYLNGDADKAVFLAQQLPEWGMLDTDCRRNALTECIYNLGKTHWTSEFPATRSALQSMSWQLASKNLLNSPLWIQQVGLCRVSRIAGYFASGQYPNTTVATGS